MTKTNEEIMREYIKNTPDISVKLAEDLIREAKKSDYDKLKKISQPIHYMLKSK